MITIRSLIPAPVRREIAALRSVELRAWTAYIRRRLERAFGASEAPVQAAGARSVLFVCHGNIMRSPAAEVMLRQRLGEEASTRVRSVGVHARPGKPADARAITAAAALGVDLSGHSASLISAALVHESDLIFVMDFANEASMRARFPTAAARTHLLGSLARRAGEPLEIRDPYMGGPAEAEFAMRRISRAVNALALGLMGEAR